MAHARHVEYELGLIVGYCKHMACLQCHVHKSCLPGLPQGETSNLNKFDMCCVFVQSSWFSGQEADEVSVNSATIRKEAPCPSCFDFTAMLSALPLISQVTGVFGVFGKTVSSFECLRLRALRVRRRSLRPTWIAWSGAFKAGRRARRGNKERRKSKQIVQICFTRFSFTACSDW